MGKMITSLAAAMGENGIIDRKGLDTALAARSADYFSADYYEHWPEAILALLEERNILSRSEVRSRMDLIAKKLGE